MRVLVDQGQSEILPEEFPVYSRPSPAKALLLRKEGKYLADTTKCLEGRDNWPFLLFFIRRDRNIENNDILVHSGYDMNETIHCTPPVKGLFDGWLSLHFEFYNDYEDWENCPLLEYLLLKGAEFTESQLMVR
jgi:hypothetical protein